MPAVEPFYLLLKNEITRQKRSRKNRAIKALARYAHPIGTPSDSTNPRTRPPARRPRLGFYTDGSTTLPMNSIFPEALSWIKKMNG